MAYVGILFWAGYAAWIALFIWIAWRGRFRLLLTLGAAMILAFAGSYAFVDRASAVSGRDHSGDIGYGLLMMVAAAVLLVPIAVAAIVYLIGRRWVR